MSIETVRPPRLEVDFQPAWKRFTMTTTLKRLGWFRITAILGLAALALTLILRENRAVLAQSEPPPPTADQVTMALLRVGLDPSTLAAAGVTSGETSTLVANAISHLTDHSGVLAAADSAVKTQAQACKVLERAIQSGAATQEQIESYPNAAALLASDQANAETAASALVTASVANLSEAKRTLISQIRANSRWELPTELLTVERTEAQWPSLRDALDNEHVFVNYGYGQDEDAEALLTQARGNSTVLLAAANLATNLQGVTSAWNAAVNGG